ncbi:MAG: aldo/keto reductase [Candidatus Paceibacterota bacterium]
MKNRILFGTWQLGGDFTIISDHTVKELLTIALKNGINRFDTAKVYGNGRVEKLLGEVLPSNTQILTKIPAQSKPQIDQSFETIDLCYPSMSVNDATYESLANLKKRTLHTVLLHNWSRKWAGVIPPLAELIALKERGVIEKIGISLPDGFCERMDKEICAHIDVIEAPYNHIESWIRNDILWYQKFNIDVILRSLFVQGLRIKPEEERKTLNENDVRIGKVKKIPFDPKGTVETIFTDVLSLNTSIVFGATNPIHLIENLSFLKSKII